MNNEEKIYILPNSHFSFNRLNQLTFPLFKKPLKLHFYMVLSYNVKLILISCSFADLTVEINFRFRLQEKITPNWVCLV